MSSRFFRAPVASVNVGAWACDLSNGRIYAISTVLLSHDTLRVAVRPENEFDISPAAAAAE